MIISVSNMTLLFSYAGLNFIIEERFAGVTKLEIVIATPFLRNKLCAH